MKKAKNKLKAVDESCIDPGDPKGSFTAMYTSHGPTAKIRRVVIKTPKSLGRALDRAAKAAKKTAAAKKKAR